MNRKDPSANCMAAWRALVDTSSALLRRLEDDLEREYELSLPAYDVLITLAEAPDHRLRHQDLLSRARLTKSGISRLVDRMEAAGLIRTERCPSDRRGAYAVLTAAGHDRLKGAAQTHLNGIQDLFGQHLDDTEALGLAELLTRVGAAFPGTAPACPASDAVKRAGATTASAANR